VAKIAGIQGLRDLPDLSKRQAGTSQFTIRPEAPGGITDTQKARLEAMAKQGVDGTLPERIIWQWLEDEQYAFEPQYTEFGGRATVGGAVIDFVVWGMSGQPVAIRVQGGYWHGPTFNAEHRRRGTGRPDESARLSGDRPVGTGHL
jgi:hypothetical protein